MRITIDTSAVIAVVGNESSKSALVEATRGASLLAPSSLHWEIGNAFSAMLRRRRLRLAQVHKALRAYAEIPIQFVDVDLADALTIAAELKLYAYDAYVLQCARLHRSPVLTLDDGLIRAAKQIALDVLEVSQ
jgi:predicted nucleic acid-binding protein